MTTEAREAYLAFALSPQANWPGNFRDLSASVTRMATLCEGGRISEEGVAREIRRLQQNSAPAASLAAAHDGLLERVLGEEASSLDRFDRVQLADVLAVCQQSKSLSEAGRVLFAQSLAKRKSSNDADRLRKYLARFGLAWDDLRVALQASGRDK
jgi:transcriptional regulatory protein RtcR